MALRNEDGTASLTLEGEKSYVGDGADTLVLEGDITLDGVFEILEILPVGEGTDTLILEGDGPATPMLDGANLLDVLFVVLKRSLDGAGTAATTLEGVLEILEIAPVGECTDTLTLEAKTIFARLHVFRRKDVREALHQKIAEYLDNGDSWLQYVYKGCNSNSIGAVITHEGHPSLDQ